MTLSGSTHRRQAACRLIVLCSDSPTFDLNMMKTILKNAVALSPMPKTRTASAASASASSSAVTATFEPEACDKNVDAESWHVKAIMEALQVSMHCPFAVGSAGGVSDTSLGGKAGGKGGKTTKGSKRTGVGGGKVLVGTNSGTESRFTAADGTQRTHLEWFSVAKNPRWGLPLVLIHQLPDLERHETESGSLAAPIQKGTSSDFCSVLQRAVQIIAEELGDHNANACTDASGEQQDLDVSEVAAVITLHDPRILQALLNHKKTSMASLIDTRLIVNFVDERPAQSVSTQPTAIPSGVQTSRVRTGASSRRAQAREAAISSPTNETKDVDGVNTSAAANNTFSACIERFQREGQVTVVKPPVVVPGLCGPVCLREEFETGSDDRSMWVRRCVKTVLPAVEHVVCDVARYAGWFSSKKVHQFPFYVTLQQQEEQQEAMMVANDPTSTSSGTWRKRVASSAPFLSSVFATTPNTTAAFQGGGRETPSPTSVELTQLFAAIVPVHHLEETWSHYIRERKVCGHWTCVSALHALAAQVTVSLKWRQLSKVVHPPSDVAFSLLTSPSQSPEFRLPPRNRAIPASLLLQLNPYCSRLPNTTLQVLDYSGNESLLGSGNSNLDPSISFGRVPTHSRSSSMARTGADGDCNPMDTESKLPMYRTIDRVTTPSDQEEVRWITEQFVKKGLGVFVSPSTATNTSDVMGSPLATLMSPSSEHFQSVLRMEQLLQEPLNGLSLEDAEKAADNQILRIVESAFEDSKEWVPWEEHTNMESVATALIRIPQVEEKLQRSIERSLTQRERTHAVQLLFLQLMAEAACIIDGSSSSSGLLAERDKRHSPTHATTEDGFSVSNMRLIEEHISTVAAVRRMYDLRSRFGAHLCRMVRHMMQDPLEEIKGDLAATCSTFAENMHPSKSVVKIMAGGVPIPKGRHAHLLWCHYVSGIPSLDQLNELFLSRDAISSCNTMSCTASTSAPVLTAGGGTSSSNDTRYGGPIGDLVRLRLLQNLCDSPQLLAPTVIEAAGVGNKWYSQENVQTVLEGHHVLYPHEDSVVEVVTTEKSRVCRYVKSSEVNCTLQYSIASSCSAAAAAASPLFTLATSRKPQDEDVHFTVSFDDGVIFTCTCRQVSPAGDVAHLVCEEGENSAALKTKNAASRGEKLLSRRSLSPGSGKSRKNCFPNTSEEVSCGKIRSGWKHKDDPAHEDGVPQGPVPSASVQKAPRPFPVTDDGSVLLWTTEEATEKLKTTMGTSATSAAESHGVFSLALTLAANGVTVHIEERSRQLWFTQHDSNSHPTPELLRCVHTCEADAPWQHSVEVEVRRVVLQDAGIICRYFHSGATQMLYPDGAVVTRYPFPNKSNTVITNRTQIICETFVTALGKCFVRQIVGECVGKFLHVAANAAQVRTTHDCGHRCRILSRADGVTVALYYRHDEDSKKDCSKRRKSDEEGGEGVDHADDGGVRSCMKSSNSVEWNESGDGASPLNLIARVTLHADGTCITSFSNDLAKQGYSNTPTCLQPLLEEAELVTTACGAVARYCVEAPSLPRVFLCATESFSGDDSGDNADDDEEKKESYQQPQQQSVSSPEVYKSDTSFPFDDFATSTSTTKMGENSLRERKPHDCFYVSLGDGSVLRRRVVQRGKHADVVRFLETLLTRPTDTSIRVLHESGLAIVEPGGAVRHNKNIPSSLAIGEGFAMFDLALGGMRLVDFQHHLTEVQQLYSSGPVHARITPSTLESLLHQLVLPTYTPHTVSKARQKAMLEEEIQANTQYRLDHVAGICPPLVHRLRRLAEDFVVSHNLLRIDVLNVAKHQWKTGRCIEALGNTTFLAGTASPWGSSDTPAGAGMSALTRKLPFASVSEYSAVAPPTCVMPILFAELDNHKVVQYLHEREVEDYLQAMEAEPFPIYLSYSTASGEPGVQQLTFFRVKTPTSPTSPFVEGTLTERSSSKPSAMVSTKPLHGFLGMTSVPRVLSAKGSLLSTALKRQEQLSHFLGKQAAFPTTRWFPPAMQLPRRFLDPHTVSHKNSKGSGVTIIDELTVKEGVSVLSSAHCEQLRVFLRFSKTTPVAQQVVLLAEAQRHRQLASLVAYQKAMHTASSKPLKTSEDQT